MQTKYTVSVNDANRIIDSIERLNKSLNKAGLDMFRYTIKDSIRKSVDEYVPVVAFELANPDVKFKSEWELVATIDHKNDLVQTYRDLNESEYGEMVEPYRKNITCDYCRKNIFRVTTHIIRNIDTGELKHLGGSCVDLFFGAKSIEKVFDSLHNFYSILSDASERAPAGVVQTYDFEKAKEATLICLKNRGYYSKKMMDETGVYPTVYSVIDWLNTKNPDCLKLKPSQTMDYEDITLEEIKTYVRTLDGVSDYERNLGYILESVDEYGVLTEMQMNYLPPLLNSCLKWKRDKTKKPADPTIYVSGSKRSEHMKILESKTVFGDYGASNLYVMKNDEGVVFKVYTTSTFFKPDVGDELDIAFTVKNVYNDEVYIKNPKIRN